MKGRAQIELTGSDRVRWLNGMVTNNIRDLAQGRGVYTFMLNPQGRILADFYVYNRGDRLLIDTDQSQAEKILAAFDHYIIMDDVAVSNLSLESAAIGVGGPNSREVLRAAGLELPELAPLEFADSVLAGDESDRAADRPSGGRVIRTVAGAGACPGAARRLC